METDRVAHARIVVQGWDHASTIVIGFGSVLAGRVCALLFFGSWLRSIRSGGTVCRIRG